MRCLIALASTFGLALIVGCGGGGGGRSPVNPTTGTLVYITDWSLRDVPGQPTGLSQRVQLFDNGGRVVESQIVNQDQNGEQRVNFSTVDGGFYTVVARLYSQRNLGGVVRGTIERRLSLNGEVTLRSAVGSTPTSVSVTPSSLEFQLPSQGRFYASPLDAGGRLTFADSSDITWQVLGLTSATVENGLVVATAAGSGSVRATHTPSGRAGSSAITVQAPSTRRSKWTVLVFLNAANDLSAFDALNINQMERVAQNPDVRFVVQWKQVQAWFDNDPEFIGTRRYLVKADDTSRLVSEVIQEMGPNVDMGRAQTLREFIEWGKTFYPADRYCLIIWNHGNGWRRSQNQPAPTRGFSYDDDTGNSIQTWELAQAIGGTRWDILSWDASLMQMIEVAYEVTDTVRYVVGSQESPPGEGLPYDRIFSRFRDNPNAPTSELTKAFVDGMLSVPGYGSRKITQSSVDMSRLPALATALSGLSNALRANQPAINSVISSARSATKGYSVTGSRNFYDIGDFVDEIDARTAIPAVVTATSAVRTALRAAVVWEGNNSNSEPSHGLSVDLSPATSFNSSSATDYARLRFAAETTWDEFLAVAP